MNKLVTLASAALVAFSLSSVAMAASMPNQMVKATVTLKSGQTITGYFNVKDVAMSYKSSRGRKDWFSIPKGIHACYGGTCVDT